MSVELLFGAWLAGLIDGEGCFRIQRNGARRGALHDTYTPVFGLKLRDDDREILDEIMRVTRLGHLARDASRSGNSRPCLRWTVDTRADCAALVELLDVHPLRTRKARDYAVWRLAVIDWTATPRGHRWRGPRDWEPLRQLKIELEQARAYAPTEGR